MQGFDRRYALWGALLVALCVAPVFSGFSHAGWELAQMAGLWAAVACILLCGAPLRARNARPPRLITLRLHAIIAWSAVAGVAAHIAGVVLADSTVVEYLRPSMPRFQLAGVAAALLFVAVSGTAGAGARRVIWTSHRGFQATHIALSCLLLFTVAVHVVTTDRYAGGNVRRLLYLAAVVGAALMLLRPRAAAHGAGDSSAASERAATTGRWSRQLVFGRYAGVVVILIVASIVLSCALLSGAARGALREPLVPRSVPLPLDFPHGKHVQVNCLTCHHNFADGVGMENCVLCHKSERTDLKLGVQSRFHEFCLECHRRPQTVLHGRGPVSECADCHRTPQV